MNFSQQSAPFIKTFAHCPTKAPLSKALEKDCDAILISLYKDLREAQEHVFQQTCFKYSLTKVEADTPRPDLYNSRYFPTHIQKYISDNEQQQLAFTCGQVGGREIKLYFTLFDTLFDIEKYVEYARQMYTWLHVCAKYATKTCAQSLSIFIYQTPFIKELPENSTQILGPEHANTAITFACAPQGQMIIFRAEEWFKVFIHETFHAYGLDFANEEEPNLKKTLRGLFPITSDFDIYEAYTETWARIINCAFWSFHALTPKEKKERTPNTFLMYIKFCLDLERVFALYQCQKLLGFMGLQYPDIHEQSQHQSHLRQTLYREKTHIFSYYILTAIFLNDYQGFLLWCKAQNPTALLRFNRTPETFKAFGDYISAIYNCSTLQAGMAYIKKMKNHPSLQRTTRMAII
jgi:hypothetical protein